MWLTDFRQEPVEVVIQLENVAFHSVHHVVLTAALDKIVVGMGPGLLPRGQAGIDLMEPNWDVLVGYADSMRKGHG